MMGYTLFHHGLSNCIQLGVCSLGAFLLSKVVNGAVTGGISGCIVARQTVKTAGPMAKA